MRADTPTPPEPDALRSLVDDEVDDRLAGESLKSNLAILTAGFAVLMVAVAAIAIVLIGSGDGTGGPATATAATSAEPHDMAAMEHGSGSGELTPAVAADDPAAKGIDFEPYEWVNPALPDPPPGAVKRFDIDVYEHVTKVAEDLAPTRVWSYSVNGVEHRGTGASEPLVVTEGDRVKIVLHNGSSEEMDVQFPHSLDFHSAEVAPDKAFATVPPGAKKVIDFTAEHPGVFMYHCATAPVLHHAAAGMMGMMVVKPADLAPVDRELWITQQEFYPGAPGEDADYAKAQAKAPDVIAFNGYANQYMDQKPISVNKGERIRMYVLNAGPSLWSAFHVIGTVFDKAVTDNGRMEHVQTVNLAPSQGGYVELTLAEEGSYPFVTHSFADMEKGATGILQTKHAEGTMKH